MQLTRHTDYSLRVLMYLALRDGGLVTIAEIANCYGISRNHLMKVANKLAALGYVETIRGRQGGLRLARAAETISVGQVVREMERNLEVVDCVGTACPLLPDCRLRSALHEATDAFLRTLDRYSLANLAQSKERLLRLIG